MPTVSFSGLLIVTVGAFLAPLLLGLSPARRLSAVVLEIVAGIVIGPAVLGWVKVDVPISILSVFGLAFLLFLAGLEVELERLRGRLLLFVGSSFLLSLGLALLVGYALYLAGQVVSPLLIAIILVATGLGIIIPVLKDAGESSSDFGQLVIAGAMFAEFGSIILLSLFFSREATNTATKLVLLAGFALLAAGFAFVVLRLERSMRIAAVLQRLQDTTAQIRVRGAFMLLVAFVAFASVRGARDYPRCLYRRRDPQAGRWRPHGDAPALSSEARSHRLRCLHPGLFRDQRAAVRPGCAALKSLNPVARAHLPDGVIARAGRTGAPLPPTGRQSSFYRRGTPAGDIPFLHRGGIPDRDGTGSDYEGDGRGTHRRWSAVSPHLPAHCAHALAPK